MSLAQHHQLDLIRAVEGALEHDGGLGAAVHGLVEARDQHEALVGAVGLLAHPPNSLQLPEHFDATTAGWLPTMVLHWVAARAAAERDEPLNGLSQWHLPWTPGRNSIWEHLFATSGGGAPGMFSTDRAAFVDPQEAGDTAVDHHPLADLLGRWVTQHSPRDPAEFAPQREDIRRIATEVVRNVAEHAARPAGRPDACLALATISDRVLTLSIADVGPGIPTTARPKTVSHDEIDDIELVWALFSRTVELLGSARNRGLPQLREIVRRWPGACLRCSSGGADLRLTDTGASAASIDAPLAGTVVSFVAPF